MSFFSNNDELRCSKTLGKSNEFLWKIDSECNMYLSRVFNLENGKTNVEDFITADELKKLDNYMIDGEWKHLANNVSKLQDGTEKEGVGTFLFLNCNGQTQKPNSLAILDLFFVLQVLGSTTERKEVFNLRRTVTFGAT